MKKASTLFLKLVIIGMALVVLGIAGILVPMEIMQSGWTGQFLLFWVFIYLTIVPFYFALFQGLKLLGYIEKQTAFSMDSVKALNYIKYAAVTMSVLYWLCIPWVFKVADMDDAPGAILLWAAFSSSPIVIAVFSSVLEKVLQNVIDMKSENDLTV